MVCTGNYEGGEGREVTVARGTDVLKVSLHRQSLSCSETEEAGTRGEWREGCGEDPGKPAGLRY